MKIKISYLEEESEDAERVIRAVREISRGVRTRKSDRHPPFKHLYLTTTNARNHRHNCEKT